MKKLNYSWKVAGFALLFGLSMGLQSCDEMIDNPLSPTQPTSQQTTPATPATPKATVKGSTVTIENCATTKDVNTLLASADVKKVFTDTEYSYYDSVAARTIYNTIEVIVKGGLETADAIAIPGTGHNPSIQLTFNDAFTKAEKDLAIKNDVANTSKFTVKLPDSESPINLDLTVNPGTTNTVAGNAVLGGIKTASSDTTWWANIKLNDGIKIKAYDADKQNLVDLTMNDNAIEAVVLNGGKDGATNWFWCYKRGFRAYNAWGDDDQIYAKNAIIAEGTSVAIYPSSTESKANKITIQKNASLYLDERQDDELQTEYFTASIESIEGADRSAKFLNEQTESHNKWGRHYTYNIGSISNVTIPAWGYNTWTLNYLPKNVQNVTFGEVGNGEYVRIPASTNSISGIDFNCDVYLDLNVAETGMTKFEFNGVNFGSTSEKIYLQPQAQKYITDASGNLISVHYYAWMDKDGVPHVDTSDPQYDAKYAYMLEEYEGYAFDTVKYEDFKAYIAFVGCKVDGKDADSKLLSPIVTSPNFGAGSQVIYQIGYNSNYRLSDGGVLVAI